MTDSTPLGPGREFDVIRTLLERWGARARGVGDDAAIVDVPPGERLVISTDTSVEGVHFRRAWLSPREIGYRATAAALSDLAAMAATPLGVLLAIAIPPGWNSDLAAIADGIADAVDLCDVPIVGGDVTSGTELSIGVTVLGSALTPLVRTGARAGDRVCVTGTLGGPATTVAALEAGRTPGPDARTRFAHPVPRLREARWLASHGATSGIDISDGLVADAAHLAAASGVVLQLELERVPHMVGVEAMAAAAAGEEYELLVTLPPAAVVHDFEQQFSLPLTVVGQVLERRTGEEPSVETTYRGERVAPPRGYDHFS